MARDKKTVVEQADEMPEEAAAGEVLDEAVAEAMVLEEEADAETQEAAVMAELTMVKDQLLRTVADFDNYRKRMARDQERMRQTAAESLVRDLLPVLDNLERALEHADSSEGVAQGLEMILTQFRNTLTQHGVQVIPAAGVSFDPNIHEALMEMESADVPAGHVAQEFQKGYWLGSRVLRPAKVAVSKGPAAAAEDE